LKKILCRILCISKLYRAAIGRCCGCSGRCDVQGAVSWSVTGCHYGSENVKSQTDSNCPVSGIIYNLCAFTATSRLVYGLCRTCAHCLTARLYASVPFNHGTVWVKFGCIHCRLCFLCKVHKGFFMAGIIHHIRSSK